nr:hypothetical protein [Tanacetum cinerariifolium]
RTRIAQSSVLPPIADKPASPPGDDSQGEACPTDSGFEEDQDRANITKTSTLPNDSTPRVTSLAADEGRGGIAQSREDASINGRSLDEGEEAAEKGSNDTEEMVTVLTSLDAATVLSSGVAKVPTGSGFIPTASPPGTGVPAGSGSVPTASPIFTTATESTPYTRRKGKETMVESETPKKKKTQKRKPLSKKQQRDFYMSVLRSNAGWKAKHFKGVTLEEIKEKFDPVWKQMQDFIPIGSKEEGERFIRKWLNLEQKGAKKVKISKEALEEVPEENLKEMMQLIPIEEVYVEVLQVKHPIIDWEVHTKGQRKYWKIIRLGGSSASYQFFMDLLKHLDRERLNQLWALVKETLNIRPAVNDKEKELWVELKRLYEPYVKYQLWTHTQNLMHAPVVGSYTTRVEFIIGKFPLPKVVPTVSEDWLLLLKNSDATSERIALLLKIKVSNGQRHSYYIQRQSTPYTRRKGKEKMVESDTPKKKKLQEQIDVQVARELEEQMAREDQRMSKKITRDAEVARIHAEEEL